MLKMGNIAIFIESTLNEQFQMLDKMQSFRYISIRKISSPITVAGYFANLYQSVCNSESGFMEKLPKIDLFGSFFLLQRFLLLSEIDHVSYIEGKGT